MEKITHKQARRRYRRVLWPAMIVYLGAILGGSLWLKQFETEPLWASLLVSISASLPVALVMFLLIRYFSETDEYNRLLHLKAFAYSAGVTMSALFFAGFLQMFDVLGRIEVIPFALAFLFIYPITYYLMGGKDCL